MDLKQLNYIVAIADEQNLSKAAQKLFVSQPALSLCLSRLEESLGLKLFERRKSAMILTPAGERYVETARRMLAMKEELYRELAQMAGEKASVLEIGIVPMTCGPMFTAVYQQYRRLSPEVTIQVSESPSRTLEALLLEQKIRLAFLTYLPAYAETALTYLPLKKEPFCIGIRADHPLVPRLERQLSDAKSAAVPVRLFRELPFILSPRGTIRRQLEDDTFQAAGFAPEISCEMNSMLTIHRMVAEGEGAAFFAEGYTLPDSGAPSRAAEEPQKKDAVRYFYIDTAPCWNIGAAYLKSTKPAPHEKQFLALAREYFRTHSSYL